MDNDPEENWKPVLGYEGFYEVSDKGRVRSCRRLIYKKNRWGYQSKTLILERFLQQFVSSKYGHLTVVLSGSGKTETKWVHRLVLEAFSGPGPDKMECCHRDDVPSHNHIHNLYWGTRKQNMEDMVRNRKIRNSAKESRNLKHA